MEAKSSKKILELIMGFFLILFFSYLAVKNQLLYYSIMELIMFILATNMFIICIRVYNIYKINRDSYFIYLGVIYGFVVFFDVLYFLSYHDIIIFNNFNIDINNQLRIASRIIESFSLLFSFVFLKRKLKLVKFVSFYFIGSLLLLISIIKLRWISNFEFLFEVAIIFAFITAIVVLLKKRNEFHSANNQLLLAAIVMTIISELFLIYYGEIEVWSHPLGYMFKLISVYLIYKIIIKKITEEVNKLSQAVEQSPSTVVITDDNGKIEYVNPKFTEITGYQYREVVGENPKILQSGIHSDEFYNDLWQNLKAGTEWRDEFYNQKKNGSFYWEDASISPIEDNNGDIHHYLKVAEDITDRKEYEQELKEKSEQLKEANDKINRDLNKAKLLHDRFLPSQFPEVEDLEFATFYKPAKKIGGDFYNLIRIDNLLIFYIVDVTGHSLDGAILNIFVRGAIDSFLLLNPVGKEEILPSDIIKFVIKEFKKENFPDDYFICLEVGILNLDNMNLKLTNAGIQVPPLITTNNEIKEVDCIDLPISAVIGLDKYEFTEKVIKLQPGDSLFFSTDGLIEQTSSGEKYGINRLKKIISLQHYISPEVILEEIMNDFYNFSGTREGKDDLTIFSFHYNQPERIEKNWKIESDLEEVYTIKNKIIDILKQNLIDSNSKQEIMIAFQELCINAIEHGNKFGEDKQVSISLLISNSHLELTIQDEGQGFDWKSALETETLDLDGSSERGRGVIIANMIGDNITYNPPGNKVTFSKKIN
ncbi:MAG: MASE3 domain-containing protein [Bacillota bacterium]